MGLVDITDKTSVGLAALFWATDSQTFPAQVFSCHQNKGTNEYEAEWGKKDSFTEFKYNLDPYNK